MALQQGHERSRAGFLLFVLFLGAVLTMAGGVLLVVFVGPKLSDLAPEVPITTQAPKGMFPPHWFDDGGTATAKPLSEVEAERAERVIRRALKKYPPFLLFTNLDEVHCVSELKIDGSDYFSTNTGEAIYICSRGPNKDPDAFLARLLHYEVGAVLLYQASASFDQDAWNAALPPGFSYKTDREVPEAQEGNLDNRDPKWLSQGFINYSGVWDQEYDFAEIAEGIMTGSQEFYRHVKEHPALLKKARLAVTFYRGLGISLPLWEEEMEGKVGPKP